MAAMDPALEEIDAVLLLHGFRTGSNYLANALQNYGIGWPAEHFNQQWQTEAALLSGDALDAHFLSVVRANLRDGVFACKLPLQDLCWVNRISADWRDPIASLAARFRRCAVVYIEREDIFAQAVSFWRAKTTDEWFRTEGRAERGDPQYSGMEIYNHYVMLARDRLMWEELLRRSRVQPLRVSYESLVSQPQALDALGKAIADTLDPEGEKFARPVHLQSNYVKQGDHLSEVIREEFLLELTRSYGGIHMASHPGNPRGMRLGLGPWTRE